MLAVSGNDFGFLSYVPMYYSWCSKIGNIMLDYFFFSVRDPPAGLDLWGGGQVYGGPQDEYRKGPDLCIMNPSITLMPCSLIIKNVFE